MEGVPVEESQKLIESMPRWTLAAIKATGGYIKYQMPGQYQGCKTVAMVLSFWNGCISMRNGPHHMTQGRLCSQGFVLCLFPPKLSVVPTGDCSALRALSWG